MERAARTMPRGLYVALLAALCLAAVAGIVALVIADSYSLTINLGYTAGALLAFGLAAAAGMSIIGGYPLAWIGWLCVVVAITGFGFTTGALWSIDDETEGSEVLLKGAGSLFVFSLALAQISLMLGRLRTGDGALVSRLVALTLLATLATATLLTIAIVESVSDELYFRLTAVVAVLSALGTALVPLLRALSKAA